MIIELDSSLFILSIISFAAFFLKGLTGFGPAIVIISVGTLFFSTHNIILTSSCLDLTAGSILFYGVGAKKNPKFLLGLLISMVAGTVIGAFGLSSIPEESFRPLLGVAILLIAIWFVFLRNRKIQEKLSPNLPRRCDTQDISFSFVGGLCGGLFGISGPPIIWHLGRRYQKTVFRSILITVFVFAAMTRVISYSITGLMNSTVLLYYLISLPGLILGLYFGNKSFFKISEQKFSIVTGLILLAISCKLLI